MQTIIADSSQLNCFDTCPVLWYYTYYEGIAKVTPVRSGGDFEEDGEKKERMNYRDMGTVFHKILEVRYKNRLTIRDCVDSTFLGANGVMPVLTPNEETLIRQTALLYDANYAINGDFSIRDPDSVELGFSDEIYNDSNYQFILEGRIDLAEAYMGGGIEVAVDHKSQGTAKKLYKKSIQFRNYAMVLNKNMLVINYIRFNKTLGKNTFVRDIASFTNEDHRVWRLELINLFLCMADFKEKLDYFKGDNEYINKHLLNKSKRRSQCSGSFGFECEYTSLCDAPNLETLINIKQMNYEDKEPFKPW